MAEEKKAAEPKETVQPVEEKKDAQAEPAREQQSAVSNEIPMAVASVTTNLAETLTIKTGASMTAMVVEDAGDSDKEKEANPKLVKIICKYPKDFKEDKHMVEGQTYFVGHENADLFVNVKKIAVYAN